MRGRQRTGTIGWFLLMAVALLAATASAQNLVVNHSFEDMIGEEWQFYGTTDFDQFSGWFGVTAQDGDWFIGSAIDGGTKSGGAYQEIDVEPGANYLFTGWVYSFFSNPLAPQPFGRIGYDPTGDTDPGADTVVWTESGYTGSAWVQLGAFFTATGDTVTIFLDMQQRSPNGFNVTAVDNASLVETEVGTVAGFVTDTEATPLGGATIRSAPYGISTFSNPDGSYSLDLPPGTYDLTATLPGYDPDAATVDVIADETTTQDFVLPEQTCVGFDFGNGGFETGAYPPWTKYGNIGDDFPGPDPWLGGLTPYEGNKFWASAINGGARGTGGAYQHVCVPSGAEVTLTAQSTLYWGTNAPQNSDGTRNRIGIDPLGDDDPNSPNIVWSDWDTEPNGWTWSWRELSLTTTAVGPKVTVYLESFSQTFGGDQWHIHGWDAVTFAAAGVEPTYGLASSTGPAGPFAAEPGAVVTDLGGGVFQADVDPGAATEKFYKGSVEGKEATLEATGIETLTDGKVRVIFQEQ